jgi:GDP-L-fucose synthase
MKTIVVTGGSGLVGNALKNICGAYNFYFIFLNSKMVNLTNYQETYAFFKIVNPDYVIHLAANVGGLYKNMNQKVQMLEDNLRINSNVLSISKEVGVKKVFCALSTCIFPDRVEYPINESMLHNGPPHSSNDAYAYAKRILDVQCKSYNTQYNTHFVCFIPTNVYGPFDNFNLEDSHVIPGLIHACYLAKKNKEPFVVKGTGKPLRQFIYSKDLARLIMLLIEKYDSTDSIILSPLEEVSIKDIAKMIADKMDYKSVIFFDESFSDGQYRKWVDNSKLTTIFPEFSFTSLGDGLAETIEWFVDNYDGIRK